ncbi:MAG: hypothetical protein HY673_25240 [Chloroflexi bacterium]|nr:hypothetical protein [Chloroflexota bacterium]
MNNENGAVTCHSERSERSERSRRIFRGGRELKDPSTSLRVTFSEQIQNANVQMSGRARPGLSDEIGVYWNSPVVWNFDIGIRLVFRDPDFGFPVSFLRKTLS